MHSEPEKSDSLEDAMMPINPSKIRPEAASWQTEDFQRLRTVTEAGMLDEVYRASAARSHTCSINLQLLIGLICTNFE